MVLLVLVVFRPLFDKASLLIGVLVWGGMLIFGLIYVCLQPTMTPMDGVPHVYVLTIVVYIGLPGPWSLALVCAVLSAVLHLILSGVLSNAYMDKLVLEVRKE